MRQQVLLRNPARTHTVHDLASINRRVLDVNRRINRCQQAIEESDGSLRPLIERIQALEVERIQLEAAQRELEADVASRQKQRPDVQQVCQLWSQFSELWQRATDEERSELMQLLVERVE